MDEPIIDLHSDAHFMGEALRQAARAYAAEEVPVGAVIVRGGRIIARASNQVELLKDATTHAGMLALTQAQEAVGDWRNPAQPMPWFRARRWRPWPATCCG